MATYKFITFIITLSGNSKLSFFTIAKFFVTKFIDANKKGWAILNRRVMLLLLLLLDILFDSNKADYFSSLNDIFSSYFLKIVSKKEKILLMGTLKKWAYILWIQMHRDSIFHIKRKCDCIGFVNFKSTNCPAWAHTHNLLSKRLLKA